MSAPTLTRPAPLWRRLAASIYDAMLMLAISMTIAVIATPVLAYIEAPNARAVLQILVVLGNWFYFVWAWTRGGQTLGMRAWHLRLRRADSDAELSLTMASARFFLMLLLCVLPIVVGGLAALQDRTQAAAWLLLWLLPTFSMALVTVGSRRALQDLASGSEMIQQVSTRSGAA